MGIWDFTNSSDYSFDSSKIEILSGQAQLKETDNWYSTSWSYRKDITIDNTDNPDTLTDYQVKVDIDYNSSMQADFDDIRFTDSDGQTLLPHWLETKVDETEATFWVKVPAIEASSEKMIYAYYGNSGANNANNGDDTFVFFDDFSQDLDKWTVVSGTWEIASHLPTWSLTSIVTNGSARYSHPILFQLLNGDIIVGFSTDEDGDKFNYKLVRSTDGGATWGDKTTIAIGTDNWGIIEGSFVQLDDGTLLVVYGDGRYTNLKTSTDNGVTWGTATTINTGSPAIDNHPSIVQLNNGDLFVAFYEGNDIKGIRSTDNGESWGSKVTISNQGSSEYDPSVVQMANGDMFVSFTDDSNGSVKLVKSTDGGNSWSGLTTIDVQASGHGGNIDPNLLVIGENSLLVAFAVGQSGVDRQVYIRQSDDGGVTWSPRELAYPWGDAHRFNLLRLQSGEIVGVLTTKENDNDYHPVFIRRESVSMEPSLIGSNAQNTFYSHIYATGLNIDDFVLDVRANLVHESRGIALFLRDSNPSAIYTAVNSNRYSTYLRTFSDQFNFYKYVNGVETNIFSTPVSYPSGPGLWYDFRVVANGSTLSSYINDMTNPVVSGTDTAHTAGTIALVIPHQDAIQFSNVRVRKYASPEPPTSLGSEANVYDADIPTIQPFSPMVFTHFTGFSETATKNGGEIKYQISNDAGTTWYWYDSGWNTTASGYVEANTASEVNSNISSFPTGGGQFLFRAYFISDGTQLIQLDSITLTHADVPSSTPTPITTPTTTPVTPPAFIELDKIGEVEVVDGIYTYRYQNGKNLTFSGTTSPNAHVTLTIQSDPITCTTQADDDGNWSCTFTDEVPVGHHTLTVSAYYPGSDTISTQQYILGIGRELEETGNPLIYPPLVGMSLLIVLGLVTRQTPTILKSRKRRLKSYQARIKYALI